MHARLLIPRRIELGIAGQIGLRIARPIRRLLAKLRGGLLVAFLKGVIMAHLGSAALRPVALLLVVRVVLAKLFLRGRDQAEVMLGVLEVVLGRDGVSRRLRIARQLLVFLRDVRRRSADLHIRTVGFVDPGQRVVPLVPATSPHALVLTVSHGLCSPLLSYSDRGRWLIERSALTRNMPTAASSLPKLQGHTPRPSVVEPPIRAALIAINPQSA